MHTDQDLTATDTAAVAIEQTNERPRKTRRPLLPAELGLLRVRELAKALGLPVRTVYKLAADNSIPALSLAGCYFFDRAAVEKSLQKRARESSADDRRYFR
jgi:excisionase family DNA binding protein